MAGEPGKQVGEYGLDRKAMEPWWLMLRSLRGGTDAMRIAGEAFLPRDWIETQLPKRYAERLARSFLFEAYDDAVKDIASRPFQRPVTIKPEELTPELQALEKNADRMGTSLSVFAQQQLDDKADRGMSLFLVDMAPVPDDVDDEGKPIPEVDEKGAPVKDAAGQPVNRKRQMSLVEQDEAGIRPYFARIAPDNIVGWRDEDENGKKVIIELRVRSQDTRQNADFSETRYDIVTVWRPETIEVWEKPTETTSTDPNYRAMLAEQSRTGHVMVKATANNFPGQRIPLVVDYTRKLDTLYVRPPMLSLAYLNVQHWQSDSQQNWIEHHARAPILKGKGMKQDDIERGITLGAGASVLSTSPDFDLNYVEPGGTSLAAGRESLKHLEARMHALGMAPLTEAAGPATATGEVRAEQKDQTVVMQWVEGLEAALAEGYKLAAEWVGQELPQDFKVSIWRDFSIMQRSQQDLTTLDAARARKDISRRTYQEEIQDRGVLSRDRDLDEEEKRIEEEGASAVEDMMANLPPGMEPPAMGPDGKPLPPGEDGEDGEEPDGDDEEPPPAAKRAGRRLPFGA